MRKSSHEISGAARHGNHDRKHSGNRDAHQPAVVDGVVLDRRNVGENGHYAKGEKELNEQDSIHLADEPVANCKVHLKLILGLL